MKTNTEKSIEFLNDCQDDYEELQEEGNNKGILEVIRLLQRGEKYEAMRGEHREGIDWKDKFYELEEEFEEKEKELVQQIEYWKFRLSQSERRPLI